MQNVEKQKIYVFLENKIGIGFRLFNKNFQNFFTLTVPEKILKNRSRFLQRKMYFFSYSIALCSTRWYLISETLHISWYQKKCDRNIWVTNHYIQGFPYKYYGIFHCFFADIITMHYVLHRLNFQRSNRFKKFPKIKKNANSL